MIFFTADIHFCDEKSMREDNRPFKSIKQYNKAIIKDFNRTAKRGDTIYVIGDMLDCNGKNSNEWICGLKLIKKINANVVLIIGNNEQRVIEYFFDGDFEKFKSACKGYGIKDVYTRLDVKGRKYNYHLVHQIVDGRKNKINLFGHTHLCSGLYHPYGICVSTDLNHFRLFSEKILEGYLYRWREYWSGDDNCNYINPFLKEVDGKIVNVNSRRKIYQKYLKDNQFRTKI